MSDYLHNIVYLRDDQLQYLINGGTIDGRTYRSDDIYITPKGTATVDNDLTIQFDENNTTVAQYIFDGSVARVINLTAGDNIHLSLSNGKVVISATQEQADWTEDNSSSAAFIKNKPDLTNISAASLQHSLTFGAGGTYVFNGSADVTVPVYTGSVV